MTEPMTDASVEAETGLSHGEMARDLAQRLLETAGLSATAVLKDEDAESVEIALEGEDAALLIGKHGQTLNAVQYLLGLMLSRRTATRLRVGVDAENYRARRAEALIQTAKALAAQVREANEEAVMDPLNAAERRIVHTALLEEPGISTYSEGEEPDRRVVISPKG